MDNLKYIIAIAPVLLSLACFKPKAPPEPVLAQINDKPLVLSEFERAFAKARKEAPGLGQEDPSQLLDYKQKVLDDLIHQKVLLQQAQKIAINISEPELREKVTQLKAHFPENTFDQMLLKEGLDYNEWKNELRDKLTIEKLLKNIVLAKIEINDDELKAYYNKHRNEFREPERVHAAQIVLNSREESWKAMQRLKNGESFQDLAKELSLGPEGKSGGDLGFFARGEMPAEFDVVFRLHRLQMSPIVESPYGYHIFKVLEKRRARLRQFDEVKDHIRQIIRTEKEQLYYQEWLKEVYAQSKILKNVALLKQI